ncbi:MAG: DUF3604 domain-containing protein [Candidatus Brocadiia bacterium]
MCHVAYPPPFHAKVIALEAPGGEPREARLVAPSVVGCGEPFALRLAVLDGDGYPSVDFADAVALRGDFAAPREATVRFERGRPALARVEGVRVPSAGLWRFRAELGGQVFHSNPVCVCERPGRRIWWGDPHVHTILSNCHPGGARSLNFCYAAARYASGLDWVAAADHVSNGRCDFSKWREQRQACDHHHEPPQFATLYAYEASLRGGCGGDNNPYFRVAPEMFADHYEEGDVASLCRQLAEAVGPENFFVVPHHTTRTGKHGEIPDAIYPGERFMPLVEIHSKWGTSEYRGNPNALKEVHPGPGYAVDLLGQGLRLGFIAGTDSHATMPSAGGIEPGHIDRPPGFTAVLAPRLGRDALFDALRSRQAYATSGERVYLDAVVAGTAMGQTATWPQEDQPRRVAARAAARGEIAKLEVVRNGQAVHELRPGSWHAELAWSDERPLARLWLESPRLGRFAYYYVRVTCRSGAQAWSSPVWLVAP